MIGAPDPQVKPFCRQHFSRESRVLDRCAIIATPPCHEAHRRHRPARREPSRLSWQHAVRPGADQADRAGRQLERLDAPHERPLPARTSTRRGTSSTTAPASRRCRSSCCSAGPASSRSTSRAGIGPDELAGIDLSEDVAGAASRPRTRGCGARRSSTPDYVGVTEAGARYLVDHGVKVLGVDYLSVEAVQEAGRAGAPRPARRAAPSSSRG